MFEAFIVAISSIWADSGFSALTGGHCIMILVGLVLLYMAIVKGFEPLLLSPIAFGCILANIPKNGFEAPGVMSVIMYGINHEVFPPLIFLGVGAMTDFGPLIANPKTLLLGAAAQAGVFVALLGAMLLGFSVQEAAAIGIIGGADGPTSIYLAAKMAPQLLGAIAVAAYSYMSLVPLIQPPIMKLFTTEADRKIKMEQLRPVSHFEKVVFPIMCTIVISLLLPSAPMLVTLSGIVILSSEVQPLNAPLPMLVTLFPIVTSVSEVQPRNAEPPILSTLSGIVMSVSEVHPLSAAPATVFVPSRTVYVPLRVVFASIK